eukprot:30894-Pelagococcus_subviridis.AAC.8
MRSHASTYESSSSSSSSSSASLGGVQSLGTCTATPPEDRNTRTHSSPYRTSNSPGPQMGRSNRFPATRASPPSICTSNAIG